MHMRPGPAGGLSPPLFLHMPASSAAADRRLSEGTFEREWEQRVASLFRSQVGLAGAGGRLLAWGWAG